MGAPVSQEIAMSHISTIRKKLSLKKATKLERKRAYEQRLANYERLYQRQGVL